MTNFPETKHSHKLFPVIKVAIYLSDFPLIHDFVFNSAVTLWVAVVLSIWLTCWRGTRPWTSSTCLSIGLKMRELCTWAKCYPYQAVVWKREFHMLPLWIKNYKTMDKIIYWFIFTHSYTPPSGCLSAGTTSGQRDCWLWLKLWSSTPAWLISTSGGTTWRNQSVR